MLDEPRTASRDRLPLFALFAGNAISMVGNAITGLAVPWFVLETTGSPAKTGIVGFAGMVPFVLGGFFGGAIVDRLGYRRTSLIADVASGVTVALIPLLYHTVGLAFWQLAVLVALGTLFDSPGRTARIAMTPKLAERAQTSLDRVNAADQTLSSLSMLVGPPLAGALIALVGTSKVLWIDAATFAVSALIVGLAVPATRVQRAEQPAGYFAAIREGLHFIASDRLMRAILPRSIVVNFLASPLFAVVLPVFAERTYGSALDFGAMIAGFGAGSVAGSIAYGAIAHRISKRIATIAGFILGGSPFWVLIFEPPLAISVGLIVLCGLSLAPLNPIFGTVLLQRTPDELRGRVLGATAAIATLCAPLGILVFGFALDWLGLSATLIAISAGMMLVGIHLAGEAAIRELDAPSG